MKTIKVQKQEFKGEIRTKLSNNILLVTLPIDCTLRDLRNLIGEKDEYLMFGINFTEVELDIFDGKRLIKHIMMQEVEEELKTFEWNMQPYKSNIYKNLYLDILEETDIRELFVKSGFKIYENKKETEYDTTPHPLMLNSETKEFFFLPYGSPSDDLVLISTQQNQFIFICYLTAQDIDSDPNSIVEKYIVE